MTEKQSKMSLYELEGIPKAYSIQAQEIQKGRDAKVQHLLAQVSYILDFHYRSVEILEISYLSDFT